MDGNHLCAVSGPLPCCNASTPAIKDSYNTLSALSLLRLDGLLYDLDQGPTTFCTKSINP